MILSGKSIFTDVTKERISRCDHPGGGWALKLMTCVLVRDRTGATNTETHGESYVTTEAEIKSDAFTSQGTPKIARVTKNREKGMVQSLP